METPILTSIVAALSALLGVALSSFFQLRTQRINQQFQLALEASNGKVRVEKEKGLSRLNDWQRHIDS
jgi:hypothetical protein